MYVPLAIPTVPPALPHQQTVFRVLIPICTKMSALKLVLICITDLMTWQRKFYYKRKNTCQLCD